MNSFFDIINIPFAYVMRFFDGFTGFYAISLFLFALVIKLLFVPVGIKQQKNQIKQASLRPKEEFIRKKYAGRTDKATQQKMQQEIMDLYQKENFNPMGGCLPLVIQLVVIMALYQIIRQPLTYICGIGADDILSLGQKYLDASVTNFSAVDQLKLINAFEGELPTLLASFPGLDSLPNFNFLGLNLTVTPSNVFGGFRETYGILEIVKYSIIPVICFVLQFVTMKLTRRFTYQSQANASTNASMKMMDFAMPLMSLFFCFGFSSAIGLYWIYSNVLSFAQTVILAKVMPVPTFTEEDLKQAEKEMKAKGYDTKKADLPRVRSLHHIDDDDYDTLPKAETTESKGASQPLLNGEKVSLKDESDKKKKN